MSNVVLKHLDVVTCSVIITAEIGSIVAFLVEEVEKPSNLLKLPCARS